MPYSGLNEFISDLERNEELQRIKTFVDPVLEIAEITDRVTKAGGKALLFENNGTGFPVLINAFGSENRISLAIGQQNLDEAGKEISKIFDSVSNASGTFFKNISLIPGLFRLSGIMPSRTRGKGKCQQVIHHDPDLGILPVLKCWPHDGNRFITLPMVHTMHPETRKTNVGMYRMQILTKNSTGMHWQLHKTGANHYEAWKKTGKKMPVSVSLGGDPVYTYAATAPLPENIDEYLLAGFLRKKRVKLVRCITNNLFVPEDADIVIEGFVDPSEKPVWEGPFGDHTGYYSLADWYPGFHVTCITHRRDAVYPATIVGIPPQEDAFFALATEKIFLHPVKLAFQPEITDLHMPEAGVAHNLVIVRINKTYSGQGMKVINSLLGAGQMMFTKYMVVVDGEVNIRDYKKLFNYVLENTDFSRDLNYITGPLDVLDHSSDTFAFGGKVGIDATSKTIDEHKNRKKVRNAQIAINDDFINDLTGKNLIENCFLGQNTFGLPFMIVTANTLSGRDIFLRIKNEFSKYDAISSFRIIVVVDKGVEADDLFTVAWQVLGNTDPKRDHYPISENTLMIDATAKAFMSGFSRKWPNIVCSDPENISAIDIKWKDLGLGEFIESPSISKHKMLYPGKEEVTI